MKKLLISLLGIGVLLGGYQVTSAACLVIGATALCSDTDVCSTAGCQCHGVPISNGVTCSLAVLGDTIRTTITDYSQGCSDVDGCICPDGSLIPSGSCTAPTPVAPVIASLGNPTVVNSTVTYSFSSTKSGTLFYIGGCGAGSPSSSIAGTNTITFTLPNASYSQCKVYIQDVSSMVSNIITIPDFVVNYIPVAPPVSPSISYSPGGLPLCLLPQDLVCTNGTYQIKPGFGHYCNGGDLGKVCSLTGSLLTGLTITGSISQVQSIFTGITGMTFTTFQSLIKDVENSSSKSVVSIYLLSGGAQVKTYLPNYSLGIIKRILYTINKSLISTVKKQWEGSMNTSYLIDDYTTTVTTKALLSKDISSLVGLYNDFAVTLYLILDQNKVELLPVIKYYLKTYFVEATNFGKKAY